MDGHDVIVAQWWTLFEPQQHRIDQLLTPTQHHFRLDSPWLEAEHLDPIAVQAGFATGLLGIICDQQVVDALQHDLVVDLPTEGHHGALRSVDEYADCSS